MHACEGVDVLALWCVGNGGILAALLLGGRRGNVVEFGKEVALERN